LALVATLLAFGNQRTKRLFIGLVPIAATGLLYDAMRFVKNVGLSPAGVHVCDLRAAELRWFGVGSGAARVTWQDWFRAHEHLALDLLCAVPYGTFIYIVMGYAVFLFLRDLRAQQRFAWGFFVLNIAAFVTYHVYPAAPPWYFHAHGCVVDLATPPSPGTHLARVDAILGFPYFAQFYSRGSDIFGAVPSLHVAYPLLMMLVGWRYHHALGRSLLVSFYAFMCFSAVYLDHHWVIDVLLGSGYTLAVGWLMHRVIPVVHAPAYPTLLPQAATIDEPAPRNRT
jgi:hypothetical protein